MNKRQAMRIALAANASYILFGASTDAVTDGLSEADRKRFEVAQAEMAWGMPRSAGFDEPMNAEAIMAAVLAE